ncbi:hypothetical protein RIF29_20158 [Crotalaria pallida]|uniref:RNase H type-1 domain-containing protein n=1 Tax=Crotalaria pallida TaxID=3830 RepID=A0AAN9F2F2_CROPI
MLRDCIKASYVCYNFIDPGEVRSFFDCDLHAWIRLNIHKASGGKSSQQWITIFLTSCYMLWKWRNNWVADPNSGYPPNHHSIIRDIAKDIVNTISNKDVEMIDRERNMNSHRRNVVLQRVLLMLQRQWEVEIIHNFREGNRCVDFLANLSFKMDYGIQEITNPDAELRFIIFQDYSGTAMPRTVRNLLM